jgi:hypothetical protein
VTVIQLLENFFAVAHFCALQCFMGILPFCISLSLVDDIHIIGPTFIFHLAFDYFDFLVGFCKAHGLTP